MTELALPQGMNMKLWYYQAGPMSGYTGHNYEAFERIMRKLEAVGLKILSPHETPWPDRSEEMPTAVLWAKMMELDLVMLRKCQGIILIHGWPNSTGANIELDKMISKGGAVFYYDEDSNKVIQMSKEKKSHEEPTDEGS